MASKMLYVAGQNNAKSEMSHRVRKIHQDQWTEPHSKWQNPAGLNGVK